jgi:flagellar hook-length control protein FliK
MPQVNTITIDIAPSNDFSPVQSGATSSSKNSNKDFSQVIEQHYQSQKSGKNQETSGNKTKLDTPVLTEKEYVQENPSPTDVQSKDKESGTVSDDEISVETQGNEETEKLLSSDKSSSDKTGRIENSQKETVDDKGAVIINANYESIPSKNTEDSTEQLMSFLSASQKILKNEVKIESTVTTLNNEKLSLVKGDIKQINKTEIDSHLKQVLSGKNKTETAENDSTQAKVDKSLTEQIKVDKSLTEQVKVDKSLTEQVKVDKSLTEQVKVDKSLTEQIKVDKSLTEQLKAGTEIKSDVRVTNFESKIKPTQNADAAIKSESKLDLSVLADKKTKNEQVSSTKETDIKNRLPNQTNQVTQKNQVVQTETTSIKEKAVDKIHNFVKQQISASDLETLVTDVEKTITEPELEKIKVDLVGNLEKIITVDKNSLNSSKVDTSVANNIAGVELSSTVQNESLALKTDTNINVENTDKVTFSGVNVPSEKQSQENSQNQNRVINQSTHKVLEQHSSNSGEQFKEQAKDQSLEQQNQKQAQTLSNAEKLVNSDAQVKEKPFSELFDKKQMNTSIEKALNKDVHQVNEATKSAVSSEEMITKLTGENVQSTAQSVTNAKQVTALQNEALSVYRKDFSGALKDKVVVMMNQKLQQVEIRLDPQELGNVNVKINLQSDQAVVSFTVQNQQAKEAFDQNLGRLKDMLAESGVDVGDANVEQQNKQNDGEALNDDRQSGEGHLAGNELSDLSDTQTLNLVKGSSTGVDYYA